MRIFVGTSGDTAILRVNEKVRANLDRMPFGIHQSLIVGRGIDDVAMITLATSPNETRVTDVGRTSDELRRVPAVSLAITKRPGSNAVVIAKSITRRLEDLRGGLVPEDIGISVTRNDGESANEKANELLFHPGLATISVVALVALAIGWRAALAVAVVIPTTILLTLFAAWIIGYTLNRVRFFALIFSIGILVDDAIVVIENIARHSAKGDGRSHRHAAIDAVAEVGNPTIVATLTVVAALLPMLFISGITGPYMSPIPANASAAMLFSFFVALMLTPRLMVKLGGGAGARAHVEGGHDWFGRTYIFLARPVLRSQARAWTFLVLVGVATGAAMALLYTKDVKVKLFPFDNKTELQVVVDLPKGASLEDTDRMLQVAVGRLAPIPEIVSFQTYAGTAAPFNFNGLVRHANLRAEPQMGDIASNLLPKAGRERASHTIALDIRKRLDGLDMPDGTVVKVAEPPPGQPVLATLLAEIYGPDAVTRRAVATKLRGIFEAMPYIVDADDSFHNRGTRVRIAIDQDNLEYYKVEQREVFEAMGALDRGTTVGYSHRGDGRHPIPIRVALAKGRQVMDERALATPVPANAMPGDRSIVELGDVVTVSRKLASWPVFSHNGQTAEMVMAELAGEFEAPLYAIIAVMDAIEAADWGDLPKPVISLHGQREDNAQTTLLWDGEWEVTWFTFRDMGAAFMVAILAIYVLVVAQFGSFKLPLVILTPIPLTLIGIMSGHWLFGAPLTATTMISFIALAGIIVRNSILLAALAAMIGAAVILTDPIFQWLAFSLLFGLAYSTALIILVIAAIYFVLRHADAVNSPAGASRS